MTYVDVILAVPLRSTFTYEVKGDTEKLQPGIRVVVPFGKNKRYVGIITNIHDKRPTGFEVKEVLEVLDEKPVVTVQMLKLWQWIADYYMSPIGDVYKAAVPQRLRTVDGYKPKTETYVKLSVAAAKDIEAVMDSMPKSAKKQIEVLKTLITLSENGNNEVSKEELINESHCTTAIVKALNTKGIIAEYEKEIGYVQLSANDAAKLNTLNTYQQQAYDDILKQSEKKKVILLYGVTSSGKTEVYIHLIRKCIDEGRQVLYLLPEIALTVQIMNRLKAVFGDELGIYHSRYSDNERAEIWQRQLSDNPYKVILGARSALFLPFQKLGLVIVDEEHETSFKQQDPAPRYNGKNCAMVLAQMFNALTVLGTATPCMETYHNAIVGKYGLVKLTKRYQDIQLPKIEVVDVHDLKRRKIMKGYFSPLLIEKMGEALKNGKQVILFQNRRGYAPIVECKDCGWVPTCNNCDVSLTYHRNSNQMVCHYCGAVYQMPEKCPNCEGTKLSERGIGTEKIEDIVNMLFPDAHVARMDLDTTRTKNAYERIIENFSQGKTNVLIGTQMVSKGLDFDNVSVVGILDADAMINIPDFRSHEHAFMMMQQVSGRAGRKGKQGLVILQTRDVNMPVIRQVVNNDYDGFYECQSIERKDFHYPPYVNLIYVFLRHTNDKVVEDASNEMAYILRRQLDYRILGPDKPGIARVRNMYIRKLVLKLEPTIKRNWIRQLLLDVSNHITSKQRYSTLQIYFDVDPV